MARSCGSVVSEGHGFEESCRETGLAPCAALESLQRLGGAAGEGAAQLHWVAQDIGGARTRGKLPRTAAGVE